MHSAFHAKCGTTNYIDASLLRLSSLTESKTEWTLLGCSHVMLHRIGSGGTAASQANAVYNQIKLSQLVGVNLAVVVEEDDEWAGEGVFRAHSARVRGSARNLVCKDRVR